MEEVAGGDAAGQLAVDVGIVGIEGIPDAYFGGNGSGAFVNTPGNGNVAVLIDEARGEVEAGGVEGSVRGLGEEFFGIKAGPDGDDFASHNSDIGVFETALGTTGPDRGFADEPILGGGSQAGGQARVAWQAEVGNGLDAQDIPGLGKVEAC